ncbi:MAG: cyclic nucleotide-binding domain-containing protein [Elusimicrobiales bacterium]|nr:cyclic nucleotide-binding domain-containing protein [Elusimicrobiales bacterium]
MTDENGRRTDFLPTDLAWLAEHLNISPGCEPDSGFGPVLGSLPCGVYVYPPNTVVLREGGCGTDVFIIRSGALSVSCAAGHAAPVELGRLREGDFFGEISFLMKTPRSATVTAETECRIFRFKADVFAGLMSRNAKLERRLRKTAKTRLEKIFLERL